ncbi:MAG: hypothetical protein AB7Y46_05605 [Armatimonadota bacterium]
MILRTTGALDHLQRLAVALGLLLAAQSMGAEVPTLPERPSSPELSQFLGAVNVATPGWQRYGLGWCRHDFSWAAIEPANDQFVWHRYDRIVLEVHQLGLEILPVLGYTAPWAASIDGDGFSPPRNLADWENFVDRVVARYSRSPFNLRYFQVWNEPTRAAGFWHGASDRQFFETVYIPAARIVQGYDCRVVLGGWPCSNPIEQLCELLDATEAWRWTDILDLHYTELSAWAVLHDRYLRTGRCRGIWQTEVGFHPFPGYLPNCYLRALHFGLRSGWQFPDQYKLFWYAFWGAGPDGPKCLTTTDAGGEVVATEHGRRLEILNGVLGGETLSAFTAFSTDPPLPPALDEEVPTALGFGCRDGRVVIALLIDAQTRAHSPEIALRVQLAAQPSTVELVTSTGERLPARFTWDPPLATTQVPIGSIPLELARNWGRRWEVALAYLVMSPAQ